jgi:flagellar hook protein FlgE
MSVVIDYTGTTQFAGEAVTTTNAATATARAPSSASNWPDGSLVAKYSQRPTAVRRHAGHRHLRQRRRLTVADSDTSWIANDSSGTPCTTPPGVGLSGKLTTGTLEGSNVDITSELVGLMTSQRNYQANSKVLTTENQMMQSLMQAM